ncbi:MAG: roadblock/LC7 domain-containing protein [Candidatus Thorarchaeota archaeon]|jgi:predicted regulator of Ras-like GTPase activity (Roadblock/LC7/MglB family)
MSTERPDYGALTETLDEMNKEGGFTTSVLARDDGLVMAYAVSPTTNIDVVAAMAGHIADTVERVRNELSLGETRDISVRCSEGKAVFKKISSQGNQALILGAIMPRNVRYHSRAVGKAATKIRKILRYR